MHNSKFAILSALLTLHRPSNVDVPQVLAGILDVLAEIQARLRIPFGHR